MGKITELLSLIWSALMPSVYTSHEDLVVKNDNNYHVRATSVLFHNQGTWIVKINELILMPGDVYKEDVLIPHVYQERFIIRFLSDFYPGGTGGQSFIPVGTPIPPNLYNGKRLYVRELRKTGRIKY